MQYARTASELARWRRTVAYRPNQIWIYDTAHFTAAGMAVLIVEDLVSRKWLSTVVSVEETSTQVEVGITAALEAEEEEEVTRRIATLRDRWAAGAIGDEDFFPLIEQLRARLAEIDHDRQLQEPMIVHGQPVTGMALRVAWAQLLEMVGHREDERDEQRGIAAQRAILAAHIERITVGPVSKRGSHTFDDSTTPAAAREQQWPLDGS